MQCMFSNVKINGCSFLLHFLVSKVQSWGKLLHLQWFNKAWSQLYNYLNLQLKGSQIPGMPINGDKNLLIMLGKHECSVSCEC